MELNNNQEWLQKMVEEEDKCGSITITTGLVESLGERMKRYEDVTRIKLLPRTPAIIRVDGKAFHTLTRGCEKPFSSNIGNAMDAAATALMDEVQNARLAHIQSDEISILMIDYNTLQSQGWYDNNVQKIVSVAASIAGVEFTLAYGKRGYFDGRVFNVPEAEVCNYFISRQQDATRNAIQMVGQAHFSHKELHKKSCNDIQEMLFQEKGINFNDFPSYWKRGRVVTKEGLNKDIPVFTQDRDFVERHLAVEES